MTSPKSSVRMNKPQLCTSTVRSHADALRLYERFRKLPCDGEGTSRALQRSQATVNCDQRRDEQITVDE